MKTIHSLTVYSSVNSPCIQMIPSQSRAVFVYALLLQVDEFDDQKSDEMISSWQTVEEAEDSACWLQKKHWARITIIFIIFLNTKWTVSSINVRKCPSQFPRPRSDVVKLHVFSRLQRRTQMCTIHNDYDTEEASNPHVWDAGTSNYLAFLDR